MSYNNNRFFVLRPFDIPSFSRPLTKNKNKTSTINLCRYRPVHTLPRLSDTPINRITIITIIIRLPFHYISDIFGESFCSQSSRNQTSFIINYKGQINASCSIVFLKFFFTIVTYYKYLLCE